MLLRFFFNRMTAQRKAEYLKRKGILLGTRSKDGRKVYIYMLRDLFVEVVFKNDSVDSEPEKLNVLKGLSNLNQYLENEFKASF